MPTARGNPAKMCLGRFLVGQMERLRAVLAGEVEHLLARHLVRAEIGIGADFQVLEIDHSPAHSGAGLLTLRWRNGDPFTDRNALASAADRGGNGPERGAA